MATSAKPKPRKTGKAPIQRAPEDKPQEFTPVGTIDKKKERTYTFTIPESSRVSEHDPKVVVMRELGPDDMALSRKLAGANEGQAAAEAVKLALWEVDGNRVNHGEDQATWYWHRFSSKVRHLLNLGWAKIHVTDENEDAAFLSSMAG